jgi:hypothetical protein
MEPLLFRNLVLEIGEEVCRWLSHPGVGPKPWSQRRCLQN